MKTKAYNLNASEMTNRYWTLRDEKPKLERLAGEILIEYIQFHGQPHKNRADVLDKVARVMGYKTVRINCNHNSSSMSIDVGEKESPDFHWFLKGLRGIRRGKMEHEIVQIADLIMSHQRWPRWMTWRRI